MSGFLVYAADLFLGASCPGCERPALGVCRSCGFLIRADPRQAWPQPTPDSLLEPIPVPPIASGVNADVLRAALIAWKEEGRFGLHARLAHLLASSIAHLAPPDRPLVLVPVPTSRRSKRARGADLVDDLAHASARLLRRVGLDVQVSQVLAYARTTADQAGLDSEQRFANVLGAFSVKNKRGLDGRDVVVVDDILTTGATVGEAVRALTAVGCRPIGIAVVAATARHPVDWR